MFPIFIHAHWISHTATSKTLSSFFFFFIITMTINFCMVYFLITKYTDAGREECWVYTLKAWLCISRFFFLFFVPQFVYMCMCRFGEVGGSRVTITMYTGQKRDSRRRNRRRRRRRREVIFSGTVPPESSVATKSLCNFLISVGGLYGRQF